LVDESLPEINALLDQNCLRRRLGDGTGGLLGIVNDAIAIHAPDPAQPLRGAVVRRAAQTEHGALRFRENEPKLRVPAQDHRSPP
jgi:hypothetical protein